MGELKLHFDDCPYNCNSRGKILNLRLRTFEDCPYCSEKRKQNLKAGTVELVDGDIEPLAKILGIENEYLTDKLVYESIIPEGETLFIEQDSLRLQKENLEEIYQGLCVGQLPERSYCFGLGNKGRIDTFAYPLLSKAYLSGLTVGKFISCKEYNRMCLDMEDELKVFYTADFLIMLVAEGSSYADIAAAKGLMQTRALKGKATIFVTTWSLEACSALLGYYDESSYFLARCSFIEYHSSKKQHSRYVNQLLGVKNTMHNDNATLQNDYGEDIVSNNSQDNRANTGKNYTSMSSLLSF